MTTTTEKLLQLAAEHEQKAQALRLAASELNGHRTVKKREVLPQQLEAAVALRRAQRPAKPKKAKRRQREKGALLQAVLAFLDNGARSKDEVAALIRERGGPMQGLGALYRYGHIKETRQGIVATAKGRVAGKPAPPRADGRAAKDASWKRAHAVLQAQGPMHWPQLRDALGLKRTTNVSGAMYEHSEALQSKNGLWSAVEH